MANILVTGGTGFIGSHVVKAFATAGHSVAILDRSPIERVKKVFDSSLAKSLTLFHGDIRDATFVRSVIREYAPTVINHHAGQISVESSMTDPITDAQTNILGMIHLLEAVKAYPGPKLFQYASSGGSLYGNHQGSANESTPPAPLSPYGISKYTAQLYLQTLGPMIGLTPQILRYSNVYGPRPADDAPSGVISLMMHAAQHDQPILINGDGEQTRDFIHVTDVAAANLAALNFAREGVWNISSNTATSMNTLAQIISAVVKKHISVVHNPQKNGEVRDSRLDNSQGKKQLNWMPKIHIEEGVRTIAGDL